MQITRFVLIALCWMPSSWAQPGPAIRVAYLSNAWHEYRLVDINSTYVDGWAIPELRTMTVEVVYKAPWAQITEIRELSHVMRVNAVGVGLTQMPIFSDMKSLRFLNLSRNAITHVDATCLRRVPQVEEVHLDENKIATIADWSFGGKVAFLSLNCNRLTKVDPKWFKDPSSVIYFHLQGNDIAILSSDMAAFTEAAWLDLSHNRVARVEARALSGPTSWILLDLSYNRLTEIHYSFFRKEGLRELIIDVSHNRLSYLPERFVSKLNVSVVSIWGNPWQCPCLDKMKRWRNTRVRLWRGTQDGPQDNPSCVYANAFTTQCVRSWDKDLYETFKRGYVNMERPVCQPSVSITRR